MSDAVLIERARCRYRVPRGHPRNGELQVRLDRLLRERVPAACDELLARSIPSGPGIVVIDRLDLRLVFANGPGGEARVAAVWARGIAVAVARALAEAAPDRVARFDDRAHRLATLVEEIASGAAWGRWYHEDLAALSGLPASAAIRTALLSDRGDPLAALARLARSGRLGAVAAVLAEGDAQQILAAIERDAAVAPAAITAPPHVLRLALAQARPALAALSLVAELAQDATLSRADVELVRHLARVAPVLRERPAGDWTPRTLMAAADAHGADAGRAVRALLAAAPTLLAEAAEAVAGTRVERGAEHAADGRELVTSFGGALLLLPALAELGLERRLRAAGLADDAVAAAVPLGRWLTLLKCVPEAARAEARHDPVLCVGAGLDAAPGGEAVAWLAELTGGAIATALGASVDMPSDWSAALATPRLAPDEHADAAWSSIATLLLRRFARGLPGFQRSGPAHLARNFVAGTSHVRIGHDGVLATLPSVPLQIVLRVAGWDGSVVEVPWLPGARLTFEADPA